MERSEAHTMLHVPERFSSLDDLHNQGFALESECEKLVLEQPWVQIARHKGISQSELGRRAGIARQTISLFATGQSRPDIRSALLICEALGIRVEQGFRLTGDRVSLCRDHGVTLMVNIRTLEVVRNSKGLNAKEFERLYFKSEREKGSTGTV